MKAYSMKRFLVRFRNFWIQDVSFITLLFMLGFTIFILPTLLELVLDDLFLLNVMIMAIFFTGIWSAKTKWLITLSAVLFLLSLILKIMRYSPAETWPSFIIIEKTASLLNIAVYIYINFSLLFRDDRYNFERVIGAVNVYLLVALAGSFLFELIQLTFGSSIKGGTELTGTDLDFSQYIYYSLSSLTTVGYGDMYPVNPAAKMLSVFLSTVGILYPAVVIARLVAVNAGEEKP